jgi:hypothetical protein
MNSNISPNSVSFLPFFLLREFICNGRQRGSYWTGVGSIASTGKQIKIELAVWTTKWTMVMDVVGRYETRDAIFGYIVNISKNGSYRSCARVLTTWIRCRKRSNGVPLWIWLFIFGLRKSGRPNVNVQWLAILLLVRTVASYPVRICSWLFWASRNVHVD